ncbi:MAG: maleylacetate reductase [bacterium]
MDDTLAPFALRLAAMRLWFGTPAADAVREALASLGLTRAVLLSTASQGDNARRFAEAVGPAIIDVFSGAVMHTPVEVTAEALTFVESVGADAVVSLGGGSTTGLGKAIALNTDLPQIVVPTTYAGSESTAILGQTEGGRKTTITDPRVQPEAIIFDPAMVATLPVALTVTSGLNAIAHAVEALYARDRNPLTSTLATEGLAAMIKGLPEVVAAPDDLTARSRTQYGAFLCGLVLGQVGMSLHHKLCHVLGGSFGLPHAETHAVILPHAVAYNAGAAGDQLAALRALVGEPGRGLQRFAKGLGAPMALRDLGLAAGDLDRATEIALQNQYWNPRPIEQAGLRALLQRAWAGDDTE